MGVQAHAHMLLNIFLKTAILKALLQTQCSVFQMINKQKNGDNFLTVVSFPQSYLLQ